MNVRLFFHIMGVEARKAMSYRVDFWISAVLVFGIALGAAWFLWKAMFASANVTSMGGFSFDAIILYMVVVVLLQRVIRSPMVDSTVSGDIYTGSLNRYLVLPIPYLPAKYAEHIGALTPSFIQLGLFGVVVAFVLGIPSDVSLTWGSVAACVLAVFVAQLVYFLMDFPLQATAFWADNVWSLSVALRMTTTLLGGALIPLTMFPEWAQSALSWTPFPILYHLPAQTLLGRVDLATWGRALLIACGWIVVLRFFCAWVWNRGRLRYSGVGM